MPPPAPETDPGTEQRTVLGTPLQCTTYEKFIAHCQARCRAAGPAAVDFSNTQIITMRRHEMAFRKITADFDYFIPDGMPLIWLLNRRGAKLRDRVYGPTFMRKCLLASPPSFTHYFLGGSPECLTQLQHSLLQQNPRLKILGARNGYFQEGENAEIVAEINRLSPDFIWVGLGTPKQQDWIHHHKMELKRGILFAVGFAFDVNAGTKKDAPLWMQRFGLTWLFRLSSEPRRLIPRYLKYNSLFLWYLLRDTLSRSGANL